jgi:hypothetical protein
MADGRWEMVNAEHRTLNFELTGRGPRWAHEPYIYRRIGSVRDWAFLVSCWGKVV